MRFFIHLLALTLIALGIGFGLSYFALTDGRFFGALRIGPWVTWTESGSPSPDPYGLAYLSRNGALQLGRAEGVRFIAETDSDSQPLLRTCNYRVDGATPVAAFWTLMASDPDWVNVARPGTQAAVNSTRVVREVDGSAVIAVGPGLAGGNWLEIAGQGPMQLALTLYDTTLLTGGGPGPQGLPSILRTDCP